MIISIERWRVWVVWLGLLGMVMARNGGHDGQNPSDQNMSRNNGDNEGNKNNKNKSFFTTQWPSLELNMNLRQAYQLNYSVVTTGPAAPPNLTLCYGQDLSAPTSTNIYFITLLKYACNTATGGTSSDDECSFGANAGGSTNLTLDLTPTSSVSFFQEGGFFLCFTGDFSWTPDSEFICDSYSPFFQMSDPQTGGPPTAAAQKKRDGIGNAVASSLSGFSTFTAPLTIISSATSVLTSVGASTQIISPVSPQTTFTSYASTVTTPIDAPTATGASQATGTSKSDSSSSSSGLSLGAKIGIAIGAVFLTFLILLLALVFLRRRRRNPKQPAPSKTPENPLLASSLQNNESRDLYMAEKLGNSIQERETQTPLTSAAGLYDDLPAPGSAFTTSTPVPISPRRSVALTTISRSEVNSSINPTNNTATATVPAPTITPIPARAISDASNLSRPSTLSSSEHSHCDESPPASREPSRERLQIVERTLFDEEPYSDSPTVPMHNKDVPKVYRGALQAPFLSEPGMSAEEVARLEEEERRIDEAIAEAEEERKRARGRL